MSGEPGRYQRSASGLVGAMLILVLVVAGYWVFRETFRTTPETPARTVDYAQVADFARSEASFDLLAPAELPSGWRSTSVRYVPPPDETWHLGVLTAEERYVGLEQARDSVDSMVEEYVGEEAAPAGAVEIGGRKWAAYSDGEDDQALVRKGAEVTTLVVGSVGQDVLVDYVKRLR